MTPLFARALARQVAQVMAWLGPAGTRDRRRFRTSRRRPAAGAGSSRLPARALPDPRPLSRSAATPASRWPAAQPATHCAGPRRVASIAAGKPYRGSSRQRTARCHAGHICGLARRRDRYSVGWFWRSRLCLAERAGERRPACCSRGNRPPVSLPPGYESEISLANRAWMANWGRRLQRGALLLLDYGSPRREYYHLQRGRGTLMCHYRQLRPPRSLLPAGLAGCTHGQASISPQSSPAADAQGLDLLGYCNQGQFLLNCGILDALAAVAAGDTGNT